MKSTRKTRTYIRKRIHERVRTKVNGTKERPRLNVSFSHNHIRAQIIDDECGKTLVGVSTLDKDVSDKKVRPNVEGAAIVGKLIADKAVKSSIKSVVFDRGGLRYHGKVKALADAAREAGLDF